jgi:hypothetical protein
VNDKLVIFGIACGAVFFMEALRVNGLDWSELIPDLTGDAPTPAAS